MERACAISRTLLVVKECLRNNRRLPLAQTLTSTLGSTYWGIDEKSGAAQFQLGRFDRLARFFAPSRAAQHFPPPPPTTESSTAVASHMLIDDGGYPAGCAAGHRDVLHVVLRSVYWSLLTPESCHSLLSHCQADIRRPAPDELVGLLNPPKTGQTPAKHPPCHTIG